MPTIASNKIVYDYSPDEVRQLIAKDLDVDPARVTVKYVVTGTGMDPSYGQEVTAIKVTVDQT